MNYPVKNVKLPKALTKVPNGHLPPTMLKKLVTGGTLYPTAADAFNAMYGAAKVSGITLANIGDYRSYEAQYKLFMERYSPTPTGRNPEVKRRWNKKIWFLRKGCAPSATPGKSNHGYGLAIDLATKVGDKRVTLASNKKAWNWMLANAPQYGFYLAGGPKTITGKPNPNWEPWHWQYCLGDAIPPYKK